VDQKRSYNKGVRIVLGDETGDVRIELPGQPRVLLYETGKDVGKQGGMKGDVVTHIGGDSIQGKSADDLLILLNVKQQQGVKKVFMTLNAERSVATALRRRAMAIAES